jgi:hypothetical protein
MEITKIKVWNNLNKTEQRVYITYTNEDGKSRSGCFYKDGNAYNSSGALENLTEDILAAAKKICSEHKGTVCYCTMYENEITKTKTKTKTKSYGYDSNYNRNYNEMKRDIAKGYPVNPDDYDD